MVFLAGVIGAVVAFIMFNILGFLLGGEVDAMGAILCGTVIISGIICGCTAWIVTAIKNKS